MGYRQDADRRPSSPVPGERGWLTISVVAASACLLLAGCGAAQPYRTAERLGRGLVIVFPGIEGRSGFNEAICRGLDRGGVKWAIELHDWTSPLGPLYNLRAHERNRRSATEIGWRIAQYSWDYPGRKVILVGQSGGGAIAVWVAEQLLPGHKIEGIILLSASLSPEYTLDFALANSRRGIVSFHSGRDWLFLGVGTTVTGTMDGRHTASAGQAGFKAPAGKLSKAAYDKLFQVAWRREMAASGHSGMHLTGGAEEFVAKYVAPLIRGGGGQGKWSRELIDEIVSAGAATQPASRPTTARASQPATSPAGAVPAGPIKSQP